ncbi:hypothetical protein C8R46DRAFT_985255 [Mycena filopes]|nr:hypothetical protein C8R46DRAFT_985255 [Mycena filopes]
MSSPRSTQLKKGMACRPCRHFKIRCDGQKPVCGSCKKHPKEDECGYSNKPSRTQVLEDEVQRLQARLRELEHPEESTPSVTLHDPYHQFHSPPPPPSPRLFSTFSARHAPPTRLPASVPQPHELPALYDPAQFDRSHPPPILTQNSTHGPRPILCAESGCHRVADRGRGQPSYYMGQGV